MVVLTRILTITMNNKENRPIRSYSSERDENHSGKRELLPEFKKKLKKFGIAAITAAIAITAVANHENIKNSISDFANRDNPILESVEGPDVIYSGNHPTDILEQLDFSKLNAHYDEEGNISEYVSADGEITVYPCSTVDDNELLMLGAGADMRTSLYPGDASKGEATTIVTTAESVALSSVKIYYIIENERIGKPTVYAFPVGDLNKSFPNVDLSAANGMVYFNGSKITVISLSTE